jgi:hypothetical protein
MGKIKRKSKQQQSQLLSSPSSPPSSTTMLVDQKSKKRCHTPQPQTSMATTQSQDASQLDICPPQVNKKLWNRFYEPLVLLSAYGKSQGRHVKFDEASSEGYSNKTLRKKFLDELAYICDYSPSGDTVASTHYYLPLIPWINRLRKAVFPMDKPWEKDDENLLFSDEGDPT